MFPGPLNFMETGSQREKEKRKKRTKQAEKKETNREKRGKREKRLRTKKKGGIKRNHARNKHNLSTQNVRMFVRSPTPVWFTLIINFNFSVTSLHCVFINFFFYCSTGD